VRIGRTRVPSVRVLYPAVLRIPYGAEPALAVAPDGSAVAAWRGARSLQVAFRDPRRARFSRPQRFPPGKEPAVAIAGGRAHVIWARRGSIQLAVAPVGGRLTPTEVAQDGAGDPSVAVTPDGTAVAVWQGGGHVRAAVRSPGGALAAPLTLSDHDRFAAGATPLGGGAAPRVVTDPQGEAIVVWQQATVPETGGGLAAAVWSAGDFGRSQPVDPGHTFAPMLAVDGRGDAVLAYSRGAAGFGDWRAREPGGAFGGPGALPGTPVFAVGRGAGTVTIGVRQRGRTRLYDVAGR
jgi:hypothetical protein